MTYNVFGGTLNLSLSICRTWSFGNFGGRSASFRPWDEEHVSDRVHSAVQATRAGNPPSQRQVRRRARHRYATIKPHLHA